jgi:fumarate hydratase subunit alpha
MREVHVEQIRETVKTLCIDATCLLPEDVVGALQTARRKEESPVAVRVLDQILVNADLARAEMLPLCQDTGTTVIFLDIGQDVHIAGGDIKEALRDGVGAGYNEGFCDRLSWISPFPRAQTPETTRHPSCTRRSCRAISCASN